LAYADLETCPFQGISVNSIDDRRAIFGANQLAHKKQSPLLPLKETITQPWIFLSVFISVICFILETMGVGNGEGARAIIMVILAVGNWILASLERLWFERRA
jgi:hypothetical protein